MKKNITEMAMCLWKRVGLLHSFSNVPDSLYQEILEKILSKYSEEISSIMEEYHRGNYLLPVLMAVKELKVGECRPPEKLYYEVKNFLDEKYKNCGAHWSAGGTGCCASACAEAQINQYGEIFSYRLSWSSATGGGRTVVLPANSVSSVTKSLDDFNHFSGQSCPYPLYEILPSENWEEIVSRFLNIQKARKKRLDWERVENWRTGNSFPFGVFYPHYKSPGIALGFSEEEDHTMKIGQNTPYGNHNIYIWGNPVVVTLKEGEVPHLHILSNSPWNDSRSWWYVHHQESDIEPGWFYVNGEDVYESTHQEIQKNLLAKKNARRERYEKASLAVTEKYGEEVLNFVLRKKKGKVLSFLEALANESFSKMKKSEVTKVISVSQDWEDILNIAEFLSKGVDPQMAGMVSRKAYAWAYLNDVFPNVKFVGNFDKASGALGLFSQNWEKEKKNSSESDLAVRLREAGLV